MQIPNLKLQFQTSGITNLSTSVTISKILAKLEDKKYGVSSLTDNSIIFKRDPFRLVWNFQAPYILDGGNFIITESEQGTVVVLNYFINRFYSLLIAVALFTIILVQGEYIAIAFFGTFYLLSGLHQYYATKKVGKDLLDNIML